GVKAGKKKPADLTEVRAAATQRLDVIVPVTASERQAKSEKISSEPSPSGGGEGEKPRSSNFDIDDFNRSFAFVIWGGKAVVVNEQPSGP
ncbi:hypothetical protein ABTC05_19065, partial [Acinetobacter baumannii]